VLPPASGLNELHSGSCSEMSALSFTNTAAAWTLSVVTWTCVINNCFNQNLIIIMICKIFSCNQKGKWKKCGPRRIRTYDACAQARKTKFVFYCRIINVYFVIVFLYCIFVRGRAGRPARPRTQHNYHHDMKVKPEAATAIIELLMMGGKTPETCWTVNTCQDNKLKNCCIRLVIYLN